MSDASAESRKLVGQVVSVSGSQASIELETPAGAIPTGDVRITVGKFLAIPTMGSSVVSVITNVDGGGRKGEGGLTARVDLLGELKEGKGRSVRFQRGITEYPVIGDGVALLGSDGLRLIYDTAGADTINIGRLQQDSSIGAQIGRAHV